MSGIRGGTASLIALAIIVIALAITAGIALAASTRAEYVAQVDPICQTAFTAERTAFHTFRQQLHREKERSDRTGSKRPLRILLRFYTRAGQIGREMDAAVASIAPAPGDEGTVQTWLTGRERSIDMQLRGLHALRRSKEGRFLKLYLKAIEVEVQAINVVRDFGFAYCTRVSIVGPT